MWRERVEGAGPQPLWPVVNVLPTLWTSERRRLCPRSLRTLQVGLGPRGWGFHLTLAAGRAARKVFCESPADDGQGGRF